MSEILCYTHPTDFILWNRRAEIALRYLAIDGLPRYNYQLTGKKYSELCAIGQSIAEEMRALGDRDADLLKMDYFLWDELQIADEPDAVVGPEAMPASAPSVEGADAETAEFFHDEVKDSLAEQRTRSLINWA